MGKKSASKNQGSGPASVPSGRSRSFLWVGVIIVLVVGGFVALRPTAEPTAAGAPESTTSSVPAAAQAAQPDPARQARADATAKFGPRPQKNLPPIPFRTYDPPRPVEVVTAAYQFAAEHPEILSYVPCFCGCEQAGHQGNHDCFVKSRDQNGDVTAWDEHGVECTVCIDVANRSRQLHASGASVRDIRAAIDKEFASAFPGKMGTPHPPGSHVH